VIFVVKIKKEGVTFVFSLQENNYRIVKLLTHWFYVNCYWKSEFDAMAPSKAF